ncbi:pyrroline-5-carboxylate reductase [Paenibacillus shirakamiensis]|uniref:Pyrroline-5-carboxylate reductase n=1 Tax=Paenibacillus shirakamiensis TaxID=1265935 RepID=A0ABS4JD02_9BACL|nr:pyrroline-5-carboxylate reductase [Paenibacillus shirakamiensis]MBP1999596.1 pyrroline-5-carboxylate reductase [Paenibacillus shirakamiensis]
MNNQEHQTPHICFYGAGSMAEAIVRGLINRAVAEPQQIAMFNRSNAERLDYLAQTYNVQVGHSAEQKQSMLQRSPILVLAMKPKDAAEALKALGPILHEDQLVVSVIAGLSIPTMQALLGRKQPIARTMPNTSSSIGLGATGIAFSKEVHTDLQQKALSIFEAVGLVTIIAEEKMDILTGISGSGPAYIYYMMEAMITAGVEGGLMAEQARELTVQTVLGAAQMMLQTEEDPANLRKAITSPNGSTQAAIEVFAAAGFTETVKAAVRRCEERSKEMGAAIQESLS